MAKKWKFPNWSHSNIQGLPRLRRDDTAEQRAQLLSFYKGMTLEELRARQRLTRLQLGEAGKQQNHDAYENMDITLQLLDQAVMEVYCPMPGEVPAK